MNVQRRRLITDGLAAGSIGCALVALFYAALDLLAARPVLHTVAVLGEGLFAGARGPDAVALATGPILAFNGIHLAAYLLFGFFGAWLVSEAERHPEFWYLALLLYLGATMLGYAAVLITVAFIGSPLSAWSVVGATLVAASGMAAYLGLSHRSVVRAMARSGKPGRVGSSTTET